MSGLNSGGIITHHFISKTDEKYLIDYGDIFNMISLLIVVLFNFFFKYLFEGIKADNTLNDYATFFSCYYYLGLRMIY